MKLYAQMVAPQLTPKKVLDNCGGLDIQDGTYKRLERLDWVWRSVLASAQVFAFVLRGTSKV